MKPEKPIPRILTTPRQFYSPEYNYNSRPIFDSPTYSPTSQRNKKRKVKKQNIAYENDEAEVEIRDIIFDIEKEEADDSDEVELLTKIQNEASKKSGLPYYLYFIVFLLFLSIGFATFMFITPRNDNRKSKDL